MMPATDSSFYLIDYSSVSVTTDLQSGRAIDIDCYGWHYRLLRARATNAALSGENGEVTSNRRFAKLYS